MKRLSILFIIIAIIAMLTISCTTVPINVSEDSQETIAKIAGRRAGFELEKQDPEISHEVLALSKAILVDEEPDIIRVVINRLVVILAAEIDDPLLAADLKDVIALVKIETGIEITVEHMRVIQATAEGLISGIEIAQLEAL